MLPPALPAQQPERYGIQGRPVYLEGFDATRKTLRDDDSQAEQRELRQGGEDYAGIQPTARRTMGADAG